MSVEARYSPCQQTAVAGSNTSANPIVAASGYGSGFRDLVSLIITTVNAAAATFTVSDGSKTVMVLNYPNATLAPGTPLVLNFCDVPLEQSKPNLAWTITASANASGYNVTAQYIDR